MNAKRLNGKKLFKSGNQNRVLSAQKMKNLERLGFDADLVELIHKNWQDERPVEQNAPVV